MPRPAATPAAGYEALDWVVDSGLRQPHLKGAVAAILVESLDTGEVLYEHGADRPMMPASNMKVVTAAAALSVLGPDYRFETVVSTDAPELGPVLSGDLYVRGTGDPSIVSEELWKLAESVRALGIERVEGDLVLDATYFDSVSTTSRVVAEGDRAYHARTGALSLNFNSIAVHVTPSDRAGAPAVVALSPRTSFVELAGERVDREVAEQLEPERAAVVQGREERPHRERKRPGRVGNARHYRSLDDGPGYFGTVLREFLGRRAWRSAGR